MGKRRPVVFNTTATAAAAAADATADATADHATIAILITGSRSLTRRIPAVD